MNSSSSTILFVDTVLKSGEGGVGVWVFVHIASTEWQLVILRFHWMTIVCWDVIVIDQYIASGTRVVTD